jgi:hypothetical protein
VGAGLGVALVTLTPALSRRERGRGFAFRCGVAPLAEIADRQRLDGGPEPVIRGEELLRQGQRRRRGMSVGLAPGYAATCCSGNRYRQGPSLTQRTTAVTRYPAFA